MSFRRLTDKVAMIKSIRNITLIILLTSSCSTQVSHKKTLNKKEKFSLKKNIDSFSKALSENKCSHHNEKISYEIFSLSNNNFQAIKVKIEDIESTIEKTKMISKQITKNITHLNTQNTIESLCVKNLKTTKTAFHILRNYLVDLHYWRTKDAKKYKGHVYNNFRISNVIKRSLHKRRPASIHSFKKKVVRRQKKLGLPLTPVEMQSLY